MSNLIKSKILELKAEAEALGMTIYTFDSGQIKDYNDAAMVSDPDIWAYYTFTYTQMVGEFTRKIKKQKAIAEQTSAKDFMASKFE